MKKPIIAMGLLIVSSSATGHIQSPPPPVVTVEASNSQRLITWQPGTMICDGAPREPLLLPSAAVSIGWAGAVATDSALKPVVIDFAIDADGRPHAIKRSGPVFPALSSDLEPALAAARFKPGASAKQCRVTYTSVATRFDSAPIESLIEYSIFPGYSRLPKAGFDRIKPAGSDCFDPVPEVRARIFPDFDAIPQPPGTRSWSMISFDIDARGRPTKVRVYRTTGNTALDRASLKAIRESRFEPGARHGCLYPYWRTAPPLAAPPIPADLPTEDNDGCPLPGTWKTKPVLSFPEAYRRRGVEGWAVIRFDVAPWGATGNQRVVASEPSDAFGLAALNTVRAATKEASPQGYVNCVTRVRFEIGDPKKPGPEAADARPPF